MYADLAKQLVRISASTGVATIVSNAARQAMPSYPQAARGIMGGLKVARVAAARGGVIFASGVLGGLVADHAMNYTDKKVDEIFEGIKRGEEFAKNFTNQFMEDNPS